MINSKIFIGQPQPAPFPIGPDAFQQALIQHLPGAATAVMDLPGGLMSVTFTVPLDGDTYSGALLSNGYLTLDDGNGTIWAEFIAWFLTLIPAHPVDMMVEVAHPSSLPIPAGASPDDIKGIYSALTASVA